VGWIRRGQFSTLLVEDVIVTIGLEDLVIVRDHQRHPDCQKRPHPGN